ncbi:MAG: ribose transport system ATP-binding protein [Streptomyces sp.]|nr:ribose transport system ATP-binding protein [Streptomyces sp.]
MGVGAVGGLGGHLRLQGAPRGDHVLQDRRLRVVPDARGELDIRLSGPGQLAGQLSGGDQQKLSLAKWLAADCDILVIDEPTVGIDVRTNPSST